MVNIVSPFVRGFQVPAWVQAACGGLLTTLTVPPFGLWPLAIPGIALLFTALLTADQRLSDALDSSNRRKPPSRLGRSRHTFRLSLLWASCLYVPSLWWMTAFSVPGGIFVGLLEATITAVVMMALVPGGQIKRVAEARRAAGVVGGLVIADSLRSLWPFGGLPLGGIDLGQANGWFAPIVSWFGRLGLVGLVSCIATGLVLTARRVGDTDAHRRRRYATQSICVLGVALALPAIAAATAGTDRATTPTASPENTRTVLVVQGGGPRGLLASSDNARKTFDAHFEATREALNKGGPLPNLILWPENTVDADTFAMSERFKQLQQFNGTFLSVGITEDGGPTEFLNAQVLIGPDGTVVDRYDKVRRVPFGEFFPLRKQIESWGLADLPNREARKGTRAGTLRGANTYGVLISYEGFFDDRARNAVNAGAEVLLIPTNASSYKTTQLPSQQVAAAQLRALETHRDTFQAGPTGYSAFISAAGKVSNLTQLGAREVFTHTYHARTNRTLYVRFNDTLALALAALLLIFANLPNPPLENPKPPTHARTI